MVVKFISALIHLEPIRTDLDHAENGNDSMILNLTTQSIVNFLKWPPERQLKIMVLMQKDPRTRDGHAWKKSSDRMPDLI